MIWLLILALMIVAVLAMVAVVILAASSCDESVSQKVRTELELLHAERRLHDVASSGFQAMLDEARRAS